MRRASQRTLKESFFLIARLMFFSTKPLGVLGTLRSK